MEEKKTKEEEEGVEAANTTFTMQAKSIWQQIYITLYI